MCELCTFIANPVTYNSEVIVSGSEINIEFVNSYVNS